MRGGEAPLERAIRRRVREEVRRSHSLREERIRLRKSRPGFIRREWFFRALMPVGLAMAASWEMEVGLAMVTLYATGSAFLRAWELRNRLYGSMETVMLIHLPVDDEEVFRFHLRGFILSSLWGLYAFLAVHAATLAAGPRADPWAWGAGMGLAVLQWGVLLSLAAALAAWLRRWPLQFTGIFVMVLVLAALFGSQVYFPYLKASSGFVFLAVPAGFPAFALRNGVSRGQDWALAVAAPAVLFVFILWPALRKLKREFLAPADWIPAGLTPEALIETAVEREMVRRSEYDPVLVEAPEFKPVVREGLRGAIPAAVEEAVRERRFLEPFGGMRPGGWVEWLFDRLLSERERAISDWVLASVGGGTRLWTVSAVVGAAAVGPVLLLPRWRGWFAAAVFILMGLMMAAFRWRIFSKFPGGGKYIPFHALGPIGYGEGSWILFKACGARCLAWLPLFLGLGAAVSWREAGSPLPGVGWVLRSAFLLLAGLPWVVAMNFSGGTNDTSRIGFRSFFSVAIPSVVSLAGYAAGALGLLAGRFPLLGAVLALGSTAGFWLVYGRVFGRGRVDLLSDQP